MPIKLASGGQLRKNSGGAFRRPSDFIDLTDFSTLADTIKAQPETSAHAGDPVKMAEHMAALALVPRSSADKVAVQDGNWFTAATWWPSGVPGANDKVLVSEGMTVTYNGSSAASLDTVRVDGTLQWQTTGDTAMLVDTMVIGPSGHLEIGTAASPITGTVDIAFANNGNIDLVADPTMLGRGLVSHGSAEIHGETKTPYLKVNSASGPLTSATTLTLASTPTNWQVGDKLVLTGTHKRGHRYIRATEYQGTEDEEITITAISGANVTFSPALSHDHDAQRSDYRAYVGNLSRNITFRSEDGDSTTRHHRGHTMFMHNIDVDVRYAAFDDLGRTDKLDPAWDQDQYEAEVGTVAADTNLKGRYSMHFHRVGGTIADTPARAIGCAVSRNPGWGFSHHSSHASIQDHVSFDCFGAHIAAEDGDETGDWTRCLSVKGEGFHWGDSAAKELQSRLRHDNGRTGDGFFFAGRLVACVDCVAAGCTHGFTWMSRSAPEPPLTVNLPEPDIAYGVDSVSVNTPPINGFQNGEAFCAELGLMVNKAVPHQGHGLRTHLDGFKGWELFDGMELSYTGHYTMDNFDLLATVGVSNADWPEKTGIWITANTINMFFNAPIVTGFHTCVDYEFNVIVGTQPGSDTEWNNALLNPVFSGHTELYNERIAARHPVFDSDDISVGVLSYVDTSATTLVENTTYTLTGTITDSMGSIQRAFSRDPHNLAYWTNQRSLLAQYGYYTDGGNNVLRFPDHVTDRRTLDVLDRFQTVILDSGWNLSGYTNNGALP